MNSIIRARNVALAMVIGMVLAACGGTADDDTADPEPEADASDSGDEEAATGSGQEIVLEFPSFQVDEPSTAAWWEEVIADFESRNPGVTVEFTNSPGGEHTNLMATRFASDTPPELVHLISRDFVSFAAQGWLDEIDSCFEDDTLSEFGGLQSFMEWEGETQGLLLNSYAYHLYYNQDLLDAAGVDVPETIDELVASAAAVDDATEAFGFAGITTNTADAYVEASMFVTGEEIGWITGGTYNVTKPEFLDVIEQYRTLLTSAPQGLGEQERNELFFTGNAAMMLDGNYFWRQIQDESNEEVLAAAGIAPAPFSVQPGSVSNSIHIPAGLDPEVKTVACDFISTISQPEFQEAYGEAISVPPPRDGAVTDALLEQFPEIELMIETKADAQSVLPDAQPALEQYGVFSGVVGEAMAELFATDRSTEEIMNELQTTLEREIPLS